MLEKGYVNRIVPAIKEAIDAWVAMGRPVGDFLQAVLCNDLCQAFGRADDHNYLNLDAIVGYLYNECPSPCWGSRDKYKAWGEMKAHQRAAKEASDA